MKKTKIIIYAIIAVVAGVLTGYVISSALWKEQGSFTNGIQAGGYTWGGDMKDEPGQEVRNRENGEQAGFKLTKGQRYYMPLVEKGDKNILLVGEDATSNNYDTVIVASISDKNKKIRLFNFPRDIYIDYSEEVLDQLREKSPKLYEAKGFQKINAAHNVGARIKYEDNNGEFGDSNFDFLADLIEEVFQIPIDDYAYVNTKGFREIVDLFGGVTINVPIRMKYDDPVQDLHIDLQPGLQLLNGEQAEWFVRFRQGYDKNGEFKNYSDSFRKGNQNEFLKAFFKQHVTLKNLGKVDELTGLLGKNIKTSIKGVKSIASYTNMVRKALTGKYDQESIVIECSESKKIDGVYFDLIKTK